MLILELVQQSSKPMRIKILVKSYSYVVYLFLNQVVDAADVVLEVLDARDPLGCRCPQVIMCSL